jgi:hypothetical protein
MVDFFDVARQVMIPMFYKETQLGRSLRNPNSELRKQLFDSILELANKADNGTLRNEVISRRIVEISNKWKVSIGQTQKLVNVYLKYYCILTKKPMETIEELDCPLDSRIMSKFQTRSLKRTSLKAMSEVDDYVSWQNLLKEKGNGIRLTPDIETYDKERIELFLES